MRRRFRMNRRHIGCVSCNTDPRSARRAYAEWGLLSREVFMFEQSQLEHKRTAAENKTLVLEILGAVVACAVLGGAAVWFFSYFGEF